ncbi:non-ribosomal peptide synthetase [Rhizobium sp. 007]|nr:non-ribosomal peptide synthetase [Rhizobium sp. 007]
MIGGKSVTDPAFLETNEADVVVSYDRDRSLQDIVRQQARIAPQATAIVFGDERLTYDELDRLSDALAGHLAELGIRKGDVVGMLLPRALNTVICMLSILKAGGVYVPLDPAYPEEHLAYVAAECAPKVVFVDAESAGRASSVPDLRGTIIDAGVVIGRLAHSAVAKRPAIEVTGSDPAYIMYTSGSTGRPKGVTIAHRSIARVVLDQNYIDFRRDDVILHAATIAFDATTFEIWGALLNGCTVAVMPDADFSLARLAGVMRDTGVSMTFLTTGLFNLFADYAGGDLPRLRHVLFGGDVGSPVHARRFLQRYPGCRLSNAYGPTETTVFAAAFTVPPGFAEAELPIGKAIAHTGICILDEELRELPPGREGQLAISGDGLAIDYFRCPERTAEKFVMVATEAGPKRCYLTGDIALLQPDGTVSFKGRRDRQVKINGKRIELDEIETALRNDPALSDAIVLCHLQGPTLKRIVAYLRPRAETALCDPAFAQEVMSRLRATLPVYMIPSATVVVDAFPLTPAGKVDRASLLPPPIEAARPDAEAVASTQAETLLTQLWSEALGAEGIDLDRNFFDLGGTSLQLLQVHAGLEARLGRAVDVVALFKHSTIRELARHIEGKSQNTARSIAAAQRAALQRKTMSQFRRSAS